MAFVAGDPAGFPKALVMGDFRLSRSRQRFVNGSGFIVLLPADAANHNSIVKDFCLSGQEAFVFSSMSTTTE